ncbi:MAG: WD40/YVTN/BNR-like repeat-containing protein [Bacilli bacterium]
MKRFIHRWKLTGSVALAAVATLTLVGPPAVNAAQRLSTRSRIALTLAPDYGPPGTRVTLQGYIPAAVGARDQNFGVITFGGWPNGLSMNPNVRWLKTNPGHFITHFTVPSVPWLSPKGEVPLRAGPYTVGLQCFGVVSPGCGIRTPEASVTFHLTGPIPVEHRIPTLTIRPSAAKPGESVAISGWAPLTEEFGPNPFGYQVVWQSDGKTSAYGEIGSLTQGANGDVSGTVRLPASLWPFGLLSAGRGHLALQYTFTDLGPASTKRSTTSVLAAKAFQILAPQAWNTVLSKYQIRTLFSNQNRGYFGAIAVSGNRVYTATSGGVWLSDNGGRAWRPLSTASLKSALHAIGYAPFMQAGLTGLTIAPGYDTHLFASAPADLPKEGAPPITDLGLYSPNGGRTWQAVPPPKGMARNDFGGFQVEGKAVWAWWQNSVGTITVEATRDGGATWQPVASASQAAEHALFFGPVPAQDYGQMSDESESIVRVIHHTWTSVDSVLVNNGVISQLATLSDGVVLLVGNPQYPIEMTTNGGRTWSYVATPPVPGSTSDSSPPAVRLLPNGALLAQDPQNREYYALNQGAKTWVRVPAKDVLQSSATIHVVGDHVYWVGTSPQGSSVSPPRVLAVPVSRY